MMRTRWLRFAAAMLMLAACVSAVARARAGLKSDDPRTRAESARFLGEQRDKVAVPELCRLAQDSFAEVRFEVAIALGRIGDKRAVEPLFEACRAETRDDVASAQVKGLTDLGGPAIGALVELLGSPRPVVRTMAASGLGRLRANQGVERLIWLLDDRVVMVRKAAARALRRIGDPRGLDALARQIESPDRETELNAEEELSGRGYDEQLDQLRALLRHGQR
ncbi:MAG: HEAT repeat domain-containing protein [candidate division WOR-3 bacterium]